MGQLVEINYTKRNIAFFLPALLEITDCDADFPWEGIDQDYLALWKEKAGTAIGENFETEISFFFMIMAALKGHKTAIGYLHFLNRLFEKLSNRLSSDQKKMICSTIRKLLKTPTLQFFNFVGELATLNKLLESNAYLLECIESPLPNDNSIDFRLKSLRTDRSILVEVLNIHLDDDRVESDPAAIDKFLSDRATKKILKKNNKLKDQVEFHLVLVLWGGWKSLLVYRDHFKNQKLHIPNVFEPLAYLQHSNDLGYYDHQFGRISTMVLKNQLPGKSDALKKIGN